MPGGASHSPPRLPSRTYPLFSGEWIGGAVGGCNKGEGGPSQLEHLQLNRNDTDKRLYLVVALNPSRLSTTYPTVVLPTSEG